MKKKRKTLKQKTRRKNTETTTVVGTYLKVVLVGLDEFGDDGVLVGLPGEQQLHRQVALHQRLNGVTQLVGVVAHVEQLRNDGLKL